jgi:hypothetical protein
VTYLEGMMKRFLLLLSAFAVLVFAEVYGLAAEVKNLVPNGGFEQSANGKVPDGWAFWTAGTTGEAVLDKTTGHMGTSSIKLSGHDNKSYASLVTNGDKIFKPGKSYLVTFWCKGSNLNLKGTSGFVTLLVDPRKADGAYLGTFGVGVSDSIYRKEDSGWQRVRKIVAIPDNPDIAKVSIKLALFNAEGSVWFDDLEIADVEESKQ